MANLSEDEELVRRLRAYGNYGAHTVTSFSQALKAADRLEALLAERERHVGALRSISDMPHGEHPWQVVAYAMRATADAALEGTQVSRLSKPSTAVTEEELAFLITGMRAKGSTSVEVARAVLSHLAVKSNA